MFVFISANQKKDKNLAGYATEFTPYWVEFEFLLLSV